MTATDATNRPLNMPEHFIPYLDKHRIYKIFKDMVRDLVVALPRDHLCHMKVFLHKHIQGGNGTGSPRVIMLVHPALTSIDINQVVRELVKDFGVFVITRRYIIDRYEKHDDYKPGCVSPEMMSEVTKLLTLKDPVPQVGWLMFDHPCSIREARCLQQDGVLPTVTLALIPHPVTGGPVENPFTPARTFFDQDFEGLTYVYRATLKEIFISGDEDPEGIAQRCLNGIQAMAAGAQGAGQGHSVLGAPDVYRVVILGPRGSGRSTQALALADHFGLVYLHFRELFAEALEKTDEVGERMRKDGVSVQMKAEIVKRRLLKKDCIDHGWVLVGYPASGLDFEHLDNMSTPPNRIIFLKCDSSTCKTRLRTRGVDWCTGAQVPMGSGPRVRRHPIDDENTVEAELDLYFTETYKEMRAAAGITAVHVNGDDPIEKVAVRVQAAVMAAPAFDMEYCLPHRERHVVVE